MIVSDVQKCLRRFGAWKDQCGEQDICINIERIEGYLRTAAYEPADYDGNGLRLDASLLGTIRNSTTYWLEQGIRTIYDSGGLLALFRQMAYAPAFGSLLRGLCV
ncbi:hypothetical protein HMPREF1986_01011 [Oribacterium sp. oral taxon 078 str. F0263]|nr:hypothetical protein HMPREF1986_01011 [Oribacterium sp. oral taxon 078 str. F0263]